jgi:hypothetical protein
MPRKSENQGRNGLNCFVFQTHPSDLIRRNNWTGEQISRRNKLEIVERERKLYSFIQSHFDDRYFIRFYYSYFLVDFFSQSKWHVLVISWQFGAGGKLFTFPAIGYFVLWISPSSSWSIKMCANKVLKRIERIFTERRINNVRLCDVMTSMPEGRETGQQPRSPHFYCSTPAGVDRCPRPIDSFKLMAKLQETPFNRCPTCPITTHLWSPFGCFLSIHLELELMATRRQPIQVNDLLFN